MFYIVERVNVHVGLNRVERNRGEVGRIILSFFLSCALAVPDMSPSLSFDMHRCVTGDSL